MTTNSINTNISAIAAQNNLRIASAATLRSVSVLSSGNRIINASDDAAGLAIGTKLATDVSTLKTALSSINQGSAVVQTADGALANVNKILQRMKSLSVQSNSGTVTDTERGFLNQEFQSLKTQLDAIRTNTKFGSSLTLLDGSISGAVAATSNSFNPTGTTTFGAVQTLFTVTATQPTDGQTILVNGATITFTTDTNRLDRVFVGANVTVTATNLSSFLNNSTDSRLSPFAYTSAAGVAQVTFRGGVLPTAFAISSANGTYTGTAATATFTTTNTTDGLSEARVGFSGSVNDSVILDTTRGGVNVFTGTANQGIRNNKDFIGNIIAKNGGFDAQFVAADSVILSIKVGDITYTSGTIADTTPAADTVVTFTGRNPDGTTTNAGEFRLTIRNGAGSTVNSQSDATTYANRFNRALETVTFNQTRDVLSYAGGGDIITNGSVTGSLLNTQFDVKLSNFDQLDVSRINVTAPTPGTDNGVIEITVNGKIFRSRSDVGTSLSANSYTVFTNVNDPREFIGFRAGATAIRFGTGDEAKNFQSALERAFGLDKGGKGLLFQVGIAATETINVTIKDVSTTALKINTADIGTANGAIAASTALDGAINFVTSVRSDVGASQSRFTFAAETTASAIQNVDAARGILLDADIASESTAFASGQVKLQAGISVLAQANQLQQNLLKLIA